MLPTWPVRWDWRCGGRETVYVDLAKLREVVKESGSAVFQELAPLDLGDGTEAVTVEDLNPMSASPRAWLRLRVSK